MTQPCAESSSVIQIKDRFRGFLPVVVDVETAGFDPNSHALLQVAVLLLEMNTQGELTTGSLFQENILPFEGSMLCLLYTSPSPRDRTRSRMPSSA